MQCAFNIIGAGATHAKVNECFESANTVLKNCHDPHLSLPTKAVSVAAHSMYLLTQTIEFASSNYVAALPTVNGANTVTDLAKIGVDAYMEDEEWDETKAKLTKKIIAHSGEVFLNLARQPGCSHSTIFTYAGTVLTVVSVGIFAYTSIQRKTEREADS